MGGNFFKFRSMDFKHRASLSHFQLRNVLACTSRNDVYYVGDSKIHHYNPILGQTNIAMNLNQRLIHPANSFSENINISTLAAGRGLLVAGGFNGEYALTRLAADHGTQHTEGLVTDHYNSITNHISIHPSRTSPALVAFASNDAGFRLLDPTTNTIITNTTFPYPINASATSPDARLRVLVGDTPSVIIADAASGNILHSLEGHSDYGFAAAWADDGWSVATGNQDMQTLIWDARMWTKRSGAANPVTSIAAEMAGVRSLHFSPVGSGKRVLVAAEPADVLSVIDAETYESRQVLDFFGEIGGVAFTPEGSELFVANVDGGRGGVMAYERCGFGELYGVGEVQRRGRERKWTTRAGRGWDWRAGCEEVDGDERAGGTASRRRRRPAKEGEMCMF